MLGSSWVLQETEATCCLPWGGTRGGPRRPSRPRMQCQPCCPSPAPGPLWKVLCHQLKQRHVASHPLRPPPFVDGETGPQRRGACPRPQGSAALAPGQCSGPRSSGWPRRGPGAGYLPNPLGAPRLGQGGQAAEDFAWVSGPGQVEAVPPRPCAPKARLREAAPSSLASVPTATAGQMAELSHLGAGEDSCLPLHVPCRKLSTPESSSHVASQRAPHVLP